METSTKLSTDKISKLRHEVKMMQKARHCSMSDFKFFASLRGKKVKRARYCNLEHIMSDNMAMVHGVWVMTLENLQYYPCKFYYYEID